MKLITDISTKVKAIIDDHVSGLDKGQVKIAFDAIDGQPPFISEVLTYSDIEEKRIMTDEEINRVIDEFCEIPTAGTIFVVFKDGKTLYASFMKKRKGDSKKNYLKFCEERYKCKFAQNAEKKSDTSIHRVVMVHTSAKLKQ